MKERPMLFSAPMIRAMLDGSKSCTRRIVKHPEYFGCLTGDCPHKKQSDCNKAIQEWANENAPHKVGDRIWAKETFSPWSDEFTKRAVRSKDAAVYRADYKDETTSLEVGGCEHWKPSIHMPRKYSRIDLEVTAVKCERLQDITEDDAIAEGVESLCPYGTCSGGGYIAANPYGEPEECHCIGLTAVEVYKWLWESICGPGSWALNPFVWCYELKRVKI